MRKIMLLLPLFILACSHAPKKEYQWVSLSEKGFTENSLTILKEDKSFESDKGFGDLQIIKRPLSPQKTKEIKKIILIGDTGCRLKESPIGVAYQNCNDKQEWGYPSVVERISAEKPDLIIHLGDYLYREKCSEGKICRQYTDTIGNGWRSWEADFFSPSQKAFLAAPWIFVRGNHEECQRSFAGYKILSDQTWPENCVPTEKTQYIQIGKLLIVQLDSSSISDKPESAENEKFWEQEFKEIEKTVQASSAKQVWLITHKPIVGLTLDEKKELTSLNNNLQKAFSKTTLSKKVDFMIAGHIHNSQFLSVGNLPKQIIVGHSGTSLNVYKNLQNRDKVLSTPINGLKINDFFSDTKSPKDFGYAVMTQAEDGVHWKLDFKNAEGKITYSYPISKIQ